MTRQMVLTMMCPYCGMAWDVASALEAGRILGRHEDECSGSEPPWPSDVA